MSVAEREDIHRAHRSWFVKTFALENGKGCRLMTYGSDESNAAEFGALTVDTSIVVSPSEKRRHSSTCRRDIPPKSGG
jgi:hypothetical protein